jgi:putative MATE family efflux protein
VVKNVANKHQFMGTEKITKLLFQFSLPAITGMVVNALYNIVDSIYIGHIKDIGKFALGGVGLVFPVMLVSFAFSVLIGLGSGNNISLSIGRQKKDQAELFLGNAVALGIIVSIILAIIVNFNLEKILVFIDTSENTKIYAKEYLSIISLGFPGAIMSFTLNAAIRADGNPGKAMATQLIGAITNIILDPIFIFVFKMGVAGAALATIISQYISAIWTIYYFISELSGIKLYLKNIRVDFAKTKLAVSIGTAPFMLQIGAGAVNYILNNRMKFYGADTGVVGIAVVQKVLMFISMPIFGINQGLQPILGYNYGAKLYNRVREALFKGIVAGVTICTFSFLSIQFFAKYIIHIFNSAPELIDIASRGLRIKTILLPLAGMQIIASIYFQAVGKPKISIFMSMARQIIVLIPCVIILSSKFGVDGVWFSTPAADFISTTITFLLLRRELNNLKKLETLENRLDINLDDVDFEPEVNLE